MKEDLWPPFTLMAKKSADLFLPAISFDRESAIPIHRQLYQSFSETILNGQLRPGMKLPSTRELSEQLRISRNTVMNAFEQLLADGFLEGRIGSGTYVTEQVPEQFRSPESSGSARRAPRNPHLSQIASELVNESRNMVTPAGLGAFRVSNPAVDLFPWTVWHRILGDCARRQSREQLSYSGPLGLLSLREAVASYLRASRNVRCEAAQVMIVSGSQQAICLTAQVLLNQGDRVLLEDPCYRGAREAFHLNGMRVGAVPVDSEGFSTERAKHMFPDARLAYVTPSHQYPLGVTMSLKRRLELLDWAAANNTWVIEDDYDSEYRFVSRPLSSLQGLSEKEQVIYAGTFSKVLFPAIRIGYLVVPHDLVEAFAAVRSAADIFAPTLIQLVLTEFLNQGHLARHLRRMRSIYAERLNCLTETVRTRMSGLACIEVADSGLHVVAFPTRPADDRLLSAEATKHGVITTPLSPCYAGFERRSGLILGYGSADIPQIEKGIESLVRVFEKVSA